jgi:hypothetical protein
MVTKVTVVEPEAKPTAKATVKIEERPLSLAEQRARSRWQRPITAVIAGALAENCGLRDRLSRSVLAPDRENLALYQAAFNELWEATKKQIKALEIFSRVDWE